MSEQYFIGSRHSKLVFRNYVYMKFGVIKPTRFAGLILCALLCIGASSPAVAEQMKPLVLETTPALKSRIAGIAILLGKQDGQTRAMAVEALGIVGEAAAAYTPYIAELLNDEEALVRQKAAIALARHGKESADYVTEVTALLKDNNADVRYAVLKAINRMGEARSRTADIAALLTDKDGYVRDYAVELLAGSGEAGRKYVPEISALLKHRDARTRSGVARALGRAGIAAAAYVSTVAKLLHDGDSNVRNAAMNALTAIDAGGIFAIEIAGLLKDDMIQPEAVYALGNLSEVAKEKAAPVVATMLKEDNPDLRYAALKALSEMGNAAHAFAPEIAARLNDENRHVRRYAIRALSSMGATGDKFAPDIAERLQDEEGFVRGVAADALGELGEAAKSSVAPAVAGLLKELNPEIRYAAVNALGNMGKAAGGFAAEVALLLEDKSAEIRLAAVTALGRMDDSGKAYITQIAKLQHSESETPEIQNAAITALVNLGYETPEFVAELIGRLKSDDSEVKFHAARELGRLGEAARKQAIPEIATWLKRGAAGEYTDSRELKSAVQAMVDLGDAARAYADDIAAIMVLGVKAAAKCSGLFTSCLDDYAMVALKNMGEQGWMAMNRALPEIVGMLIDEDIEVRRVAADAMGIITYPEAGRKR